MDSSHQTFKLFNEIRSLFNRFDTELDLAEFVVVGKPNCGKNVFIKAFTGFEIFSPKFELTGVRFPIRLILHHEPMYKKPVWSSNFARKNISQFTTQQGGEGANSDMDALRRFLETETVNTHGIDFSKELTVHIWGESCEDFTLINTPELDTASSLPAQTQVALRTGLKNLIQDDNRTVVCIVDCSSEDWTASDMVELCRSADPQLTRSVFVATSVRDKMQEFFSKEDAEAFLRGPARPESTFAVELTGLSQDSGQPANDSAAANSPARRRAIPSRTTPREPSATQLAKTPSKVTDSLDSFFGLLSEKDAMLIRNFQNLNVAEKIIREHVGFGALKEHLKDVLVTKLLSNIPALQSAIDRRMRTCQDDVQEVDRQLRQLQHNPTNFSVTSSESEIICFVAREYRDFMAGTTLVDSDKWGQMLGEEVTAVMKEEHPEIEFNVEEEYELVWGSKSQLNEQVIINAGEQLYGGAQFARLLSEIECVVRSQEMPPLRRQQLVNTLGHAGTYDLPNYLQAITTIVRELAPQRFLPLMPCIRKRMQYILRRSFSSCLDYVKLKAAIFEDGPSLKGQERLFTKMQRRFEDFLADTCRHAESALRSYVVSALAVISFRDGMRLMPLRDSYVEKYTGGELDSVDISERVMQELRDKDDYKHIVPSTDPAQLEFLLSPLDNSREVNEKTGLFFRLWSGYLFAAIREHLANSIRVLLDQHFLHPLLRNLANNLLDVAEDNNPEELQKDINRQVQEYMSKQSMLKGTLVEMETMKNKLANVRLDSSHASY